MAIKGYLTFPKVLAILEPHHHPEHSLEGVLPLCRDAVGVFYSPVRLGKLFKISNIVYQVFLSKMNHYPSTVWFQISNNNNNNNNNNTQREYKARHDWVGKVIHWEMCKKFKFDHTKKWYMHNPAPVLENDTHKLLWDFNIQTDHLIPARRPDLIIINKKRELAKQSTLLFRLTTE